MASAYPVEAFGLLDEHPVLTEAEKAALRHATSSAAAVSWIRRQWWEECEKARRERGQHKVPYQPAVLHPEVMGFL
jgi:hypothetical protein